MASMLDIFLSDISGCPKLSRDEQAALHVRAKAGDTDAMQQLTLSVLPWAIKIAAKYKSRNGRIEPMGELVSWGMPGLMEAVEKWEPARAALTTFMYRPVLQSIAEAARTTEHAVSPPRNKAKTPKLVHKAQRASVDHCDLEVVGHVCDRGDSPVTAAERAETIARYRAARDALPGRLRQIIVAREQGDTYKMIGDRVGLSRERIRQLVVKAYELICETMRK